MAWSAGATPAGEPSAGVFVGRFGVEQPPNGGSRATSTGLHVEDQIKPAQNLAITLGIRWDREIVTYDAGATLEPLAPRPAGLYDDPARARHAGTHVAPAVNVSWDPWSDSRTKLFLAGRRYHDRLFPLVPLFALEPLTMDLPLILVDGALLPDPAAEAVITARGVARDLATPRTDEWILGFEREIATEMKLRISYVHRSLVDQPQLAAGGREPAGSAALDASWVEVLRLTSDGRATYEALVVELTRRQYRSWEMRASYTLSSLRGNGDRYDPLLVEDGPLTAGGWFHLAEDRRHELTAAAAAITPWGFRVGGSLTWLSGLPYSTLDQRLAAGTWPDRPGPAASPASWPRQSYVGGGRNDSRNRSVWNVDARLTKSINLGRGTNVEFSLEVYNLLNERTHAVYDAGIGTGRVVNGVEDASRRFGRRFQFGTRLSF